VKVKHRRRSVYQMLSRAEVYIELGGDYYDLRNKPKVGGAATAPIINAGLLRRTQTYRSAAGSRRAPFSRTGA